MKTDKWWSSLRTRIALTTAALIMATGALVVGSVYVYMRFAPDYLLVPQATATSLQAEPTVEATSSTTPAPVSSKKPGTETPAPKKVPINSVAEIWSTLLTISLITFAVLTVLGAVAAWFVAGRQLRPLRRLADEVAATSADTLASPIEATGPMDEVHLLTESINAMKTRLNASFEAERRFASNASHELKTPLFAAQALLDVALDQPAEEPVDPLARRELLQQLRGLSSQSLTTLDALLDLAEVTSVPLQREPVDISELIADALTQLAPLAAFKSVTLTAPTTGSASVLGDAPLLAALIRNLVANAIQYNVPGGQVTVAVMEYSDVVVRVENDGAVLTDAQVAQLAEPFYRVAGRVESDRGHGLGCP